MNTSTQITSVLLATMALTSACGHKKSKDHKDDKQLPTNTAQLTADSLARSQTLSHQLSPALARSLEGLNAINPMDQMTALLGQVSGKVNDPARIAPSLNTLKNSRFALASNMKPIQSPVQKLAVATQDDPEETVSSLLDVILKPGYAAYAADGLIFYRLDGLNGFCDGDSDCLKTLQTFQLGAGTYGDNGLSLQFNVNSQNLLGLKIEPSKVAYRLDLTAANKLLSSAEGVTLGGVLTGALAVTDVNSSFDLTVEHAFTLSTKDDETGEVSLVRVAPKAPLLSVNQDLTKQKAEFSLNAGRIDFESGQAKLALPGFGARFSAEKGAWSSSVSLAKGDFMATLPSDSGEVSHLKISIDRDWTALISSSSSSVGSFSLSELGAAVTVDGQNLATLTIKPKIEGILGSQGIKIAAGSLIATLQGSPSFELKPNTCFRPVLDSTGDDSDFDDVEVDSELLATVPCQS